MPNQESNQRKTDFGFKEVPWEQKKDAVSAVFSSVAEHYDLMNDLMSFGIHRYWKRQAIALTGLKKGDKALDLACGTGDLSLLLMEKIGEDGTLVMSDINAAMLERGSARLLNEGKYLFSAVQANAESLPFEDNSFDCITIGFGLRNVTDKAKALHAMYRCLKPGGRLIVLEFSQAQTPIIQNLYDFYSFQILPKIGKWVANDEDSYRYLAESIRMHPNQEHLKDLILAAGFDTCRYYNFTDGIVAIHQAMKY